MEHNNDKSWMQKQMELLKKKGFSDIEEGNEMKFINDEVIMEQMVEKYDDNESKELIDIIDPNAPDFSKFGDLAEIAEIMYYKDLEEKLTKEEEKERDRKRKILVEKANKIREKEIKAINKERERKLKELNLVINRVKTNVFTSISELDDTSSIMKTSSQRTYNEIYTYSGSLIARADRIELGKSGYYYLYDSYSSMFYLFKFDSKSKKNNQLGSFKSENELLLEAKKIDNENKLGFKKDALISEVYKHPSDEDKTIIS